MNDFTERNLEMTSRSVNTSPWWEFFTEIIVERDGEDEKRAQCQSCEWSCVKNGTSNMRNHMIKNHVELVPPDLAAAYQKQMIMVNDGCGGTMVVQPVRSYVILYICIYLTHVTALFV
jgi:hypothetical protein